MAGTYVGASAMKSEVYGPIALNPGEEMVLWLRIEPAIPANTDNLVTIGTPNGVTPAAPFSR